MGRLRELPPRPVRGRPSGRRHLALLPALPRSEARTSFPRSTGWLREPHRPLVLAISRPSPKKNLPALVEAFGRDPRLRETANLAIFAGVRRTSPEATRRRRRSTRAFSSLRTGTISGDDRLLPKKHSPEEVPDLTGSRPDGAASS